jgi:hypothetical protein
VATLVSVNIDVSHEASDGVSVSFMDLLKELNVGDPFL